MRRTDADQELRRVGQFTAEPELQRTLAEFEQNAHRAIAAHKDQKADRHQATAVAKTDTRVDFGQTLLYDPTPGPFTVTLPKVSQLDHGKTIRMKNVSSSVSNVTIRPATGQLIDGQDTGIASGAGLALHLYCDGTGWWRV